MKIEYLSLPDRRLAYSRQFGDDSRPGLIFLGGYASDMTGTKASFLAERCATAGISYLRFDYRGHGQSDGDFIEGSISDWLADTEAAFNQLTKGPQIVVGSSMGGWIALLLALRQPERVKALVGIAAAPDFTEELMWQKMLPEQRDVLLANGLIYDDNAPPDHCIPTTLKLIEDGRQHLLLRDVMEITCPVRLLQGLRDTEVPWQTALRIARHIRTQDLYIGYVKDGDHRLSQPDDLALLWRTIEPFLVVLPVL